MQIMFGASLAEISDDGHDVQLAPAGERKDALVLPFLQASNAKNTSTDMKIAPATTTERPVAVRTPSLILDGPVGASLLLCTVVVAVAFKHFLSSRSGASAHRASPLQNELDYATFMKRYGGKTR